MFITFVFALLLQFGRSARPEKRNGMRQAVTHEARPFQPEHPDPVERFAAVQQITDSFMQKRNATEHLSDEDTNLLKTVLDLIVDNIYASVRADHDADQTALNIAASEVDGCNGAVSGRQAEDGDVGKLEQHSYNSKLKQDNLQEAADQRDEANSSAWRTLTEHMQGIREESSCSSIPTSRTTVALDAYYENAHAAQFIVDKDVYLKKREAHRLADVALQEANRHRDSNYEVLQSEYCDWSDQLNAACIDFDDCYELASKNLAELTASANARQNARIKAHTAGERIVANIQYMLGTGQLPSEDMHVDTSLYTLVYPVAPAKALCDLARLTDSRWDPPISCLTGPPIPLKAVSGCTTDIASCAPWFSPMTLGLDDAYRNEYNPRVVTLPRSEESGSRWWTGPGCSSNVCSDVWMIVKLANQSAVTMINFLNYQCPYGAKELKIGVSSSLDGPFTDARVFSDLGCGSETGKFSGRAPTQNHCCTVPDEDLLFEPPLVGQYVKIEVLKNHGSGGTGFFRMAFTGLPAGA